MVESLGRHAWRRWVATLLVLASAAACDAVAPASGELEGTDNSPTSLATVTSAQAGDLTLAEIVRRDERFTIFASLGERIQTRIAGLPTVLEHWEQESIGARGAGITVFVPTDEAFAAVPGLVGTLEDLSTDGSPGSQTILYEFVAHHFITRVLLAADIEAGPAGTWNGDVEFAADPLRFGGHEIVGEPLRGVNGVIHVLSGVVLPANLQALLVAASE